MRAFDICFLESLYGILGEGGLFSGGGLIIEILR